MAGASSGCGILRMLDCLVCFQSYNTTDRVPKALRCSHTVCSTCTEGLVNHGMIKCPKCREMTVLRDIRTNYTLTEILARLCVECKSEEQTGFCSHCSHNLCRKCLDNHSSLSSGNISNHTQMLLDEISTCKNLSIDSSAIKEQGQNSATALKELDSMYDEFHDMMNSHKDELKRTILMLQEKTASSMVRWRERLDAEVIQCKTFVDQSISKQAENYMNSESKEETETHKAQCMELISKLAKIRLDKVVPLEYKFHRFEEIVPHICRLVVNDDDELCYQSAESVKKPETETETETSNSSLIPQEQAQDPTNNDMDDFAFCYKPQSEPQSIMMNYICATNKGRGTGPGEFNEPWGIALTPDGERVIVTDQLNHRIQILTRNLDFIQLFGCKGSGRNMFNEPSGVTVINNNEMFICDSENHCLQVYSLKGEFIRIIGSFGTGDVEFNTPLDIASYDDELYICDSENHRIQVIKTDGTFVDSITKSPEDHSAPFCNAVNSRYLLSADFDPEDKGVNIFRRSDHMLHCNLGPATSSGVVLNAAGLAIRESGYVFAADKNGTIKVYKGNSLVYIIHSPLEDGMRAPHGIVFGNNDDLYVCDQGNHRIVKFDISELELNI